MDNRMFPNSTKFLTAAALLAMVGCAALPVYQANYPQGQEVRVLVFNFGGPVRPAGSVKDRTDLVARLMAERGVSIACIQEGVGGPLGFILHGTSDSIADLAGQVGQVSFSSLTWEEFGLQWRTGVTSRWSLGNTQGVTLTHEKGATVVTTHGLGVASCHLSSKDPEGHFSAVLGAFGSGPGIIAGDMNRNAPGLSQQVQAAGFQEVPLPPGATACDRLFYRGLEFVGAEVVLPASTGISDHNGLFVILKRQQ
jgi:hypothetical protein